MEVSIAIDQGNSRAKVAVFAGKELVELRHYEPLRASDIMDFAGRFAVRSAIYSSVRLGDEAVAKAIDGIGARVVTLDHLTPMPLTIDYATPATLGHDRIAAAVGASNEYPGCNCLVVDAGTAVTLDVVTADCRFAGGRISPGVRMRFEALHRYTSRLPLIGADGDAPLVGYDTATAIRSGVVHGVVGEIESCYHRLCATMGDRLKVILTGGDAALIAGYIGIDAIVDENILMKGLNRILLYNDEI
ncbi:MAG: type III pantothenate kinase [Muribaculaceae bacterium]